MSHSWAKKLISVTTAVSLAAALVVGVFLNPMPHFPQTHKLMPRTLVLST